MIGTDNIAYIAGLFDGEGSITYKKYWEKRKGKPRKYLCWRIVMEISMTDEYVIRFIHELLKVGTVRKKPRNGHKMQWRWRCCFRDALLVCKLIWPYAQVKLHKVEQIIDHYDANKPDRKNVVDLDTYRRTNARPQR
jgi:hypothetical protein